MSVNNLLDAERQTWKALNVEDLIVQDQTIVEDITVDGTLTLNGTGNIVKSDTAGLKMDVIFVSATGVITTFSPLVFTSAVWSPAGTLNLTVANGYYLATPQALIQLTTNTQPSAVYTGYYGYTVSTATNLTFFVSGSGFGTNGDVQIFVVGK
jgi:hypothetical protein